jgi:hypothetical protein
MVKFNALRKLAKNVCRPLEYTIHSYLDTIDVWNFIPTGHSYLTLSKTDAIITPPSLPDWWLSRQIMLCWPIKTMGSQWHCQTHNLTMQLRLLMCLVLLAHTVQCYAVHWTHIIGAPTRCQQGYRPDYSGRCRKVFIWKHGRSGVSTTFNTVPKWNLKPKCKGRHDAATGEGLFT